MNTSRGKVVDLRAVAEQQRIVTYALVYALIGNALLIGTPISGLLVLRNWAELMRALGYRLPLIWLACAALLLPLVNLIVILIVNLQACSVLQRVGVRVGFLGVAEHDMHKFDEHSPPTDS